MSHTIKDPITKLWETIDKWDRVHPEWSTRKRFPGSPNVFDVATYVIEMDPSMKNKLQKLLNIFSLQNSVEILHK